MDSDAVIDPRHGVASALAAAAPAPCAPGGRLAPLEYGRLRFLPDFTEHPKPKRRKSVLPTVPPAAAQPGSDDGADEEEVTFLQDFVAGGMAGSASVVVGHPLDTMKVRVQNSVAANVTIASTIREFGGVASLFRGMGAPLGTAALVNAIVFSSYGVGSTAYDQYITSNRYTDDGNEAAPVNHDPWQKSMLCGSFAGFVQCFVICPMEHVKCRLQMQGDKPAAASTSLSQQQYYKGPIDASRRIVAEYGVRGLYQGWYATLWREVPAFGAYFAIYDSVKDRANTFFARQAGLDGEAPSSMAHTHTWLASTVAGGLAGSITWGFIYPIDVIKSHIQTAPLDAATGSQRSIRAVARGIVQAHGWRHLFRGIGITLVRAFPVNGTIFPVYEFTLMHIKERRWGSS